MEDQHLKFPKCFFGGILNLQGSLHFQRLAQLKKDRHFLDAKNSIGPQDQSSWPSSSWLLPSHWRSHVISVSNATGPANFRSSGKKTEGANCFSVSQWMNFSGAKLETHPQMGLKGCLGGFLGFRFLLGAKGGFGDGAPRKKVG